MGTDKLPQYFKKINKMLAPQNTGTDHLGRYYTNNIVGSTLVQAMSLVQPKVVMDLGAGNGALSLEASKIWTETKFISVDIDDNISLNQEIFNNTHHTQDALNSQLHNHLGLPLGSIDGAICNPPYIRPIWRTDFLEILEDAGLSEVLPSIGDVGADILFIAQNLRFLKPLGKLGLILPDGVIAGKKYSALRKILLSKHRIERVIELPRKIFLKTDARAHILILTKEGQPADTVAIQKLEENGKLSEIINLPISKASHRMDYTYAENQQAKISINQYSIREVCSKLTRGQLSSVEVKSSKVKIFHSTNFPKPQDQNYPHIPDEFIISEPESLSVNTPIAQAGDILICRVGRNLEKKTCYVHKGYVALSDCVYKLEIHENYRSKVLNFLCSAEGQDKLRALAHGVGAKYLSKDDIFSIMIDNS